MYRRFVGIAIVSIMLLILSGCMTSQTSTTITDNGSGSTTMYIGFTREMIELMGEDPFADVTSDSEVTDEGWYVEVEPWQDATYQGVQMVLYFNTLEELEAQLNALLGPEADSDTVMFEQFTVRQEGNTVIINTMLKQDATEEGDEDLDEEFMSDYKVTLSFEMPTIESFTEESIATLAGNRITWDFPFNVERDYYLEVRGTLNGIPTSAPQPEPMPTQVSQPEPMPTQVSQPEPTPIPPLEPIVTPEPTPIPPLEPVPSHDVYQQGGLTMGMTTHTPSNTDASARCFDETPYCISGRIRTYWEENGGLRVFGLPITPQQEERIEGNTYQVQWFERNRLELHPENQPPYDVMVGRIGIEMLEYYDYEWHLFEKSVPQEGCLSFEETEQTICGDILAAWHRDGLELDGVPGFSEAENAALFGLPVSGLVEETLSDGNTYTVQYFERARFELHPENAPPNNVLLGLLGSEMWY